MQNVRPWSSNIRRTGLGASRHGSQTVAILFARPPECSEHTQCPSWLGRAGHPIDLELSGPTACRFAKYQPRFTGGNNMHLSRLLVSALRGRTLARCGHHLYRHMHSPKCGATCWTFLRSMNGRPPFDLHHQQWLRQLGLQLVLQLGDAKRPTWVCDPAANGQLRRFLLSSLFSSPLLSSPLFSSLFSSLLLSSPLLSSPLSSPLLSSPLLSSPLLSSALRCAALRCAMLRCAAPRRAAPRRAAPRRAAPRRTAPHRTAPPRPAPPRAAPRRAAPRRAAPHRTAPHRTAPHRTALLLCSALRCIALHAARGAGVVRDVAIIALVMGVRPGTITLKLFPAKLPAGLLQGACLVTLHSQPITCSEKRGAADHSIRTSGLL